MHVLWDLAALMCFTMLWCLLASLQGCTLNQDNSCTWTQPFTSARIRTLLSPVGSWKYGRVEVRAQMPRGDFLWPAIWMLPTGELVAGVEAALLVTCELWLMPTVFVH
jgi:hypothetical protein